MPPQLFLQNVTHTDKPKVMRKLLYLPLLLIFSCAHISEPERELIQSECSIDSIDDLSWLDFTPPENPDHCRIVAVYEGRYEGQTVIIPILSGALCCTCGNAVYQCNGELLFACDRGKEDQITEKSLIWEK